MHQKAFGLTVLPDPIVVLQGRGGEEREKFDPLKPGFHSNAIACVACVA